MDSSLFGYPIITYVWVIGLASISGSVKYLNEFANTGVKRRYEVLYFLRDILSGALSGLMAFWICDSFSIKEPLNAVVVALAGIMGNRAWTEFEVILKSAVLKVPVSASAIQPQQVVINRQIPQQQVQNAIDIEITSTIPKDLSRMKTDDRSRSSR
jgi:hypothetical protein